MEAFSGAVLTGGRSRRMGTDKALIDVGGRPLVTVARDALLGARAAEVMAIGGDLAALAELGFRPVEDRHPGQGPLGGLLTALGAATFDPVVVLACDLVAVPPKAVTAMLEALGDGDAAVPMVQGRRQVLQAAYRRRCEPALRAAYEDGVRSVQEALGALDLRPVTFPDDRWADDADEPGDLSARLWPWAPTGSPN